MSTTARLRRLALPIIFAGLLAGCSGGTAPGSLEVGDCFSAPEPDSETREIFDVDVVECEEAHKQEVFAVEEQAEGDYPGVSELEAKAQELCAEEFQGYVGTSFDLSELEASYIVPTEDSWKNDDRDITCTLGAANGPEVSESYKGSSR
ncbi:MULTISPECIES: septum formation family protein [unclassified Arthrobacter]|uniref:septum formation family protein n=1 Tax=unclassified Arthrobacter TaxID=235627 RepID=UPI001D146D7F|nr:MULTISPECIES: septum formation family protein [unclassified Arthrobacter]MCC3276433.1 septum formation family protein [Arthrobacter sp. zg-Y20]MCC3280316.1 septum formation family protein [Arthrobacter sp. zg-Y40]MCC9178585.1 septum formation family protein [Arthrobacter sp. zg-Y750]MDK1316592.1 septum formation family protein [Arthrobacter sp. zg.Y20]MDK1328742.1 septum formation family protein [Arthrobacter sp. zg-Y1143]